MDAAALTLLRLESLLHRYSLLQSFPIHGLFGNLRLANARGYRGSLADFDYNVGKGSLSSGSKKKTGKIRRGNGICGGALLFCDQKSNQKSLAVSTQRTPSRGASPPCTPKEVENLKIHHQNHDRTVLVTNFQIFL